MDADEAKEKIKQHRKEIKKLKIFLPREPKPLTESSMRDNAIFIELYPLLNEDLSMRMIEVIAQVVQGRSNREAGEALFVCEKTIKFHLTDIYKRLGLKSRSQLIVVMNELIRAEREEKASR